MKIEWSAQSRAAMDQAISDAAVLGVTVTVAAGDNGSTDGVSDGAQHCDFPASSPHALACGGTRLEITPSGGIASETVWNDTAAGSTGGGAGGGGYSDQFAVPAWQATVISTMARGATASGATDGAADMSSTAAPEADADLATASGDFDAAGAAAHEEEGGLIGAIRSRLHHRKPAPPDSGPGTPATPAPAEPARKRPPAPTGSAGRGVPDVAGNADPVTGYQIVANGQQTPVGGTSAVAPLWAGLIARLSQASASKKFGMLQPLIYAGVPAGAAAPGFNDITAGNNGAYEAAAGWDPCTGMGSPNGPALLERVNGN